jgi:hypothetical protein
MPGPSGRPGGRGRLAAEEEEANGMVKKVLVWLAIAFAAFYLFTQPTGAAHAVRGAAGGVVNAFGAVVTFVTSLAG